MSGWSSDRCSAGSAAKSPSSRWVRVSFTGKTRTCPRPSGRFWKRKASTFVWTPNVSAFRGAAKRLSHRWTAESADKEVVGTHVLLAVGRRPNTDDLGLEKAGVAM